MKLRAVGAAGGRRLGIGLVASALVLTVAVAVALVRVSTPSTRDPEAAADGPPSSAVRPSTTVDPTTTSSAPPLDRRAVLDAGTEAVPPALAARVLAALSDPVWGEVQRSISVWVEGYG